MDDGEVKINTKIDTSGIDEGVEKINGKLKKAGADAEKISKGTVAAVAGTVIAATKKILAGIREVTEAQKVQSKAEKAVETAALNNPYINGDAVQGLKEFASELQAVTNYGDEMTLQYAAQLVAMGRTQSEIEGILKVSADLAASKTMSYESAVRNLAKTYSGLAGELGESIPAVRELTQEELRQGKAIEVIAEKYGGLAESLVDTRIQAENAKGDLKEALGNLTAPAANTWDRFFKGFYEKAIEAVNWLDRKLNDIGKRSAEKDIRQAVLTNFTTDGVTKGGEKFLSDKDVSYWLEYYDKIYKKTKDLSAAEKERLRDMTKGSKQSVILTEEQEAAYFVLLKENELRKRAAAAKEKELKIEQEKTKELEKQNAIEKEMDARNAQAANIKAESEKSLDAEIARIKKEAEIKGEAVDQQAIYNAVLENYLDLILNSNGLITENNALSKTRLEQLHEAEIALKEQIKDEEKLAALEQAEQEVGAFSVKDDVISRYTAEQEHLQKLKEVYKNADIENEQERADAIAKIDEQALQNKKDFIAELTAEITSYTGQVKDIVTDATALMTRNTQMQTDEEIASLERKYQEGTIGEKEYQEKKKAIQKKGAQEQYKIDMFQWTSSILLATANIAEGVTKAIAQGFPMGIINGALLAAAGGVQLASIIASKPQPPKFAHGGIVGGNSYQGDNVIARVNSGEMILTTAQQRALFQMADRGIGTKSPSIVINNNAANIVTATPQLDRDRLAIMIDAHINDSMARGKYNESMALAQQGANGEYIGI